jgi:hypothetical protein
MHQTEQQPKANVTVEWFLSVFHILGVPNSNIDLKMVLFISSGKCLNYATAACFHILWNLLFVNHRTIRRFMV